MALELYIPPCVGTSAHPLHPPPLDQPLRIQIEGLLVSIQKLLPEVPWHTDVSSLVFPQPAGPELARLAYQKIYGHEVRPDVAGDMIVRDEYLGWVTGATPLRHIDYYGVTFDHLVPADNLNPKVLQINIIEMDNDGGAYANEHLPFAVDPAEYTGKKVLALPRCCQKRNGTQDCERVNSSVAERNREMLKRESVGGTAGEVGSHYDVLNISDTTTLAATSTAFL